MENTSEELYEQRIERLKLAMNLKEPDRVPIAPVVETWVHKYAGKTIQEAAYCYDKAAESYEKVILDFQWDAIWPPGGLRPPPVLDAVHSTAWAIPGRELSPDSPHQFSQTSVMEPEEYEALINDPYEFIITCLPRKCVDLRKPYPRNLMAYAKGALAYREYLEFWKTAFKKWTTVYGMPLLARRSLNTPLDFIGDYLRGFRETMLDIKLRPDMVKEACESVLKLMIKLATTVPPAEWPPLFMPLHLAPFLRPSEFENIYWPTFKELIIRLTDLGYTFNILFEHNWIPYLDYLKELPKRKIIGVFELGDMRKIKDMIGDRICILGGVPNDLLIYGTSSEVKKHCKWLIDEIGAGGGYIMGGSATIMDAKPENVKTMTDFTKQTGFYEHKNMSIKSSQKKVEKIRKELFTSNLYVPWENKKKEFETIKGREELIGKKWNELEENLLAFTMMLTS